MSNNNSRRYKIASRYYGAIDDNDNVGSYHEG